MNEGEATTKRADPDEYQTRAGLAAGRRLFDRFTLEVQAGRGGMGVVWRAHDEKLGRTVALKFLPPEVSGDPEAVRDLKRETTRCLELTHPHIVRVYDFMEEPALAAISMEFIEGQSLAKYKLEGRGGCLTVAEVKPIATQLCAALDYAHNKARVVHRDLKPANVLLNRTAEVKVTDFGIARSLTESHTRLTGRSGDASGTLPYMSPQQLAGDRPHAADDIYALGATLYELLSGKPPFYRGDPYSLVMQIREKPPLPLSEQRAELEISGEPIPREWEETIMACLAKDPAQRPKTVGEVARRLGLATTGYVESGAGSDAAVRPVTGPIPIPPAPPPTPPVPPAKAGSANPRRIQPYWIAAAAAAAVLVVATALYLLWPLGKGAFVGSGAFVVTVDPPTAEARVWAGPVADREVTGGRAVLRDLPDGEHELIVQAPGYKPFTTRVRVSHGRGSVRARLEEVKGDLAITARPGTQVTAVDAKGGETRLGQVPADGVLHVDGRLTVGRYTLRLEHPDCTPLSLSDQDVVVGRVVGVTGAQVPRPGELRIFTTPAGAEVKVNGQAAGLTPATLRDQPAEQELHVEVYERGYHRVEKPVTLKPGEMRNLDLGVLIAESGSIEVRITDDRFSMADAAVRVDGRPVVPNVNGRVLVVGGLEVGARSIEVIHPNYEPWPWQATVIDQGTTRQEMQPRPKPGRLSLRISGPPEYQLWVNGRLLLAESYRNGVVTLPPQQEERLEVRAPGYQSAQRTVNLPANGTESWSVSLEKVRGPEGVRVWTVPDLDLQMMPIRPGTFALGSEKGNSIERPVTQVTITGPYWLGRNEVTQSQFEAIMKRNPATFKGKDRPVEQVSWDDAMEFCRKLTERERATGALPAGYAYTLPTEAQWEYACRAGTTADHAGSLEDMGWYDANSAKQTHPVGEKQPNAWGLCDMHGNVWEWCRDWYGSYPGGSVQDYTGPASGTTRVFRGGSWNGGAALCRSAFRNSGKPDLRNNRLGFRIALTSSAR